LFDPGSGLIIVSTTHSHPRHEPQIGNTDDFRAPNWLPDDFIPIFRQVLGQLPAFPDRKTFAIEFSRHVAKLSHRTVEAWPLTTRRIFGRACPEARELLEMAFRKMLDAPAVRGGRNRELNASRSPSSARNFEN
jgi:hypothetical protein